ncbi:MAG: zeta toxin family protein [Candidatus Symbiothrix sp.]|jgi:predicted ABC-type ATPase|nr:zeta toxin family protein [Candidatus Symbiothrix sp.]
MEIKPKLLIIAGPNGSGKTSITSKILKHDWVEGCVYINPDNIARDIFGDWNSPEAIMKAVRYASERREECLRNRESLLFETVLSAPDKLEFIAQAQKAGYFIRLFFVGTDHPAINASRIAHRVLEGGHDVPISKIVSRYAKSIANCSQAAQMVDRMYVYDNSIDNAFPKLLFRTINGKIEKTYSNINPWAELILQVLQNQ